MAIIPLNGIELNVQTEGSGDLVVLVMGTGSPGRVWRMHQVPALVRAGYRVAYAGSVVPCEPDITAVEQAVLG